MNNIFIIYNNKDIIEYIKDNNNIIIFSLNDINIDKNYGRDKLREEFIKNNLNYNVKFINYFIKKLNYLLFSIIKILL
jgi:hypothetical protein